MAESGDEGEQVPRAGVGVDVEWIRVMSEQASGIEQEQKKKNENENENEKLTGKPHLIRRFRRLTGCDLLTGFGKVELKVCHECAVHALRARGREEEGGGGKGNKTSAFVFEVRKRRWGRGRGRALTKS